MKKLLDQLHISEKDARRILLNGRANIKTKINAPKILGRYFSDKKIKFAVISDTHLNSRLERLDELHTFYAICKKIGVEAVFHSGDILDGNGRMYRGHLNEIHTYGVHRQVDYIAKNYPRGIPTFFITGNHDLSFYNDNGIDVGNLIEKKRKDMIYLGQYQADFTIGRAKIRLLHPDGGVAYALSYRGQKISEQIPSGNKPDILLIGHFHTSFYFWYRNIHILNCGSFQGQTLYLLRKGLNPAIGGWTCEIRQGKRDRVVAFQPCWIPFFDNKK